MSDNLPPIPPGWRLLKKDEALTWPHMITSIDNKVWEMCPFGPECKSLGYPRRPPFQGTCIVPTARLKRTPELLEAGGVPSKIQSMTAELATLRSANQLLIDQEQRMRVEANGLRAERDALRVSFAEASDDAREAGYDTERLDMNFFQKRPLPEFQSSLNDTNLCDAELIAALHDELLDITDDIDNGISGTILSKIKAMKSVFTDRSSLREQVKSLAQRLEELKALGPALEPVREVFGFDKPYPLHDVLEVLSDAAGILLDDKSYDGDYHERFRICQIEGRNYINRIRAAASAIGLNLEEK